MVSFYGVFDNSKLKGMEKVTSFVQWVNNNIPIWFISFDKSSMVMTTGKLGEGYIGTLSSISAIFWQI